MPGPEREWEQGGILYQSAHTAIQNIIDWGGFNKRNVFFFTVQEARNLRSRCHYHLVLTASLTSRFANSHILALPSHGRERISSLVSVLIKGPDFFIRSVPSLPHLNQITSQRHYLQTPSYSGLGLHYLNLGRTQCCSKFNCGDG